MIPVAPPIDGPDDVKSAGSSQGGGSRITSLISPLFTDGKFSDVTFVVGEEKQRIAAHRVVLALYSSVFAQQLFPEEKISSLNLTIDLPDVKVQPFEAMLKTIYQNAEIPVELVDDVIALATRYEISVLKSKAADAFQKGLTMEKSFGLVTKAMKEENKLTTEAILELAARSADQWIVQEGWLSLPPAVVLAFIQRNDLATDELTLFEALVNWGKAECKRESKETPESMRIILKDMIPHIRFPLLNITDISTKIAPANVVTEADMVKLFTYVGSEGAIKVDDMPFKTTRRLPKPGATLTGGAVPVAPPIDSSPFSSSSSSSLSSSYALLQPPSLPGYYSPTSPAYSPTSPAYSPTSPAYSPYAPTPYGYVGSIPSAYSSYQPYRPPPHQPPPPQPPMPSPYYSPYYPPGISRAPPMAPQPAFSPPRPTSNNHNRRRLS